jgi:hypothetical protein
MSYFTVWMYGVKRQKKEKHLQFKQTIFSDQVLRNFLTYTTFKFLNFELLAVHISDMALTPGDCPSSFYIIWAKLERTAQALLVLSWENKVKNAEEVDFLAFSHFMPDSSGLVMVLSLKKKAHFRVFGCQSIANRAKDFFI